MQTKPLVVTAAPDQPGTLCPRWLQGSRAAFAAERIADGRYLEVNAAFAQVLGYAPEELVGHSGLDLGLWVAPQQRQNWLDATVGGADAEPLECTLRHKSGHPIELLGTAHTVAHGGENCMVMVVYDVTQQKRQEQQWKEREALLAEGQTIAKVGSWQVTLGAEHGSDVWFLSDGLKAIYGYPPERQVTGQDGFDVMHPDDRAEIARLWSAALRPGGPTSWEHRIVVHGAVKWLRVTARLDFNTDGRPVRANGTCQDITQERVAQEAVLSAERLYRNLANSVPSLIWQTGTDQMCNYFNEPWLAFTGRTLEQEVGDGWTEGVHPEDLPACVETYTRAFARLEPFSMEYRLRHVDGTYRWLHEDGRPNYDGAGRYLGYIGACSDITRRRQAEHALAASERLFRAITDTSPLAIYMSSGPEQRAGYVNPTFERLFGYTLQEVPTVADWWPKAYPDERYRAWVSEEWNRRALYAMEHRTTIEPMRVTVTCKDGSTKRIQWGFVGSGEQNWAFGLDVSASEEAQANLQLAASVFSHAREGIMITDANGNILDVNETFTRITGYSRDEVRGKNPRVLSSGRQSPEFYTAMWRALLTDGYWSGEVWNRRKDGEVFAELQTVSAVRNEQGEILQFVALFSDITTLKHQQQRLESIAHFDALTRLPNRVLLADRLQQAMAQSQRHKRPMALAYLDLDGFKAINDLHGHNAGDFLLQALATRMQQCLREGDTLARLGGDEFVAVFGELNTVETLSPVFTRLLEAASSPVDYQGQTLQVSASIGVVTYPQQEPVEAEQLLRQADHSMYRAKLAGKNRIHFFGAH